MEEKTIIYDWPQMGSSIFADDYINPTSDVLLGNVDESQCELGLTLSASDFIGWPVLKNRDVVAFQDTDTIGPIPAIPDERSPGHSQMYFVTMRVQEQSACLYALVESWAAKPRHVVGGISARQFAYRSHFYPDSFTIKKLVRRFLGHTSISTIQETTEVEKNIPITVAPEVVFVAEKENFADDLETSVKIAMQSYSTITRIQVNIEHDPEISDRKTIRFTLSVSGEPASVLEDEARFKKCLHSIISARTRELITVTYNWKT